MVKGFEQLKVICECLKNVCLDDIFSEFNIQCVECLELDNLMEMVYVMVVFVNFCIESCGVYSCFDFLDCDDENWLCYFLYLLELEFMMC